MDDLLSKRDGFNFEICRRIQNGVISGFRQWFMVGYWQKGETRNEFHSCEIVVKVCSYGMRVFSPRVMEVLCKGNK